MILERPLAEAGGRRLAGAENISPVIVIIFPCSRRQTKVAAGLRRRLANVIY